jgi:hypothetical protein
MLLSRMLYYVDLREYINVILCFTEIYHVDLREYYVDLREYIMLLHLDHVALLVVSLPKCCEQMLLHLYTP